MKNTKKIKKNNQKNIISIYFLIIATGILSYFVRVLFARNLSVEEYGLFYAVFTFIFFFMFFRELGLTEGLVFFINKFIAKKDYKNVREYFYTTLNFQVITSLFFFFLFLVFSKFLTQKYFKNELAGKLIFILAIAFLIHTIFYFFSFSFNIFQDFKVFKFLELLEMLFIFLFSIFLFNFFPKNIVPALAYLFSFLILAVISIILFFKKYTFMKTSKLNFNLKALNKLFKFSIPIFLSTGSAIILSYTDIILLTIMKGVRDVGLYNIAQPAFNIILVFTAPLSTVVYPLVSKKYHNKDHNGIRNIINFFYNNFLLFTLPLAITFIIFADLVIKIFFGINYVEASTALRILSAFFIFIPLRSLGFSVITGIGKPKERAKILYYGAFINFIGDILLIPKYGYNGAALTTGISFLVMGVLTTKFLNKTYKIKVNLLTQAKVFLASIIFLFVNIVLRKLIVTNNVILKGIIMLLISGSTYILLLFLLGVLTREKIKSFKEILKY
ncbi:MAG: flippase [Candidatus Woesearchaeota archaeon]